MRIVPYQGYLNLRGDPANAGFVEAVGARLGQPLPLVANTFTQGRFRVFWLGPDEWMVQTEPGGAEALEARLADSLAGQKCSLTDMTGSQICIRLSGARARDLLAKGCTLDLHPRVFTAGDCAQTVLGKASMLIALSRASCEAEGEHLVAAGESADGTDDGDLFDIIVRRTFADYAARWLYRGALEFGVTVDCVG